MNFDDAPIIPTKTFLQGEAHALFWNDCEMDHINIGELQRKVKKCMKIQNEWATLLIL